jgi:PPE-repeat protein
MIDFGLLPPEVNSVRMYTGPGASSLQEAAAGWESISQELTHAAQGYLSQVTAIPWSGPSALAMRSAGTRFASWLMATATMAETTAAQARGAAGAFEAAYAATVPPEMVFVNRSLLATLVATNLLGQNTPAIGATEALYAEMWAQDTSAMTTYQASSQAAATLDPPADPPAATNPLSSIISTLDPNYTPGAGPLQNLAGFFTSPLGLAIASAGYINFDPAADAASWLSLLALGNVANSSHGSTEVIVPPPAPAPAPAPAPTPLPATRPLAPTASAGSANNLGRLSVPPSWPAPERPRVTPLPLEHQGKQRPIPVGLPVIPAVPVMGAARAKRPGYSDPDEMHYGRPVGPVVPKFP